MRDYYATLVVKRDDSGARYCCRHLFYDGDDVDEDMPLLLEKPALLRSKNYYARNMMTLELLHVCY